ncbi:unnamed protein product, partial [marine sediment metagenome]
METKLIVIDIVQELVYDVEAVVTETSKIVDDLGMDALDYIELIMALEEEYGIVLVDEEIPNIETVTV